MPPQFSVIITSYNQARFLRDALTSVFDQSLQDFEIVIVDDGSADGTHQLIAELQGEHPGSIEAVFHERRRNQGIETHLSARHLAVSRRVSGVLGTG